VLSGDTRVSDNLIRHAQGVDVLVHEVAAPETFQRAGAAPERAKSVVAHHVTPEQAGEVFSRTKPKLAVYSHIVLPTATEQDPDPTDTKDLLRTARAGRGLDGYRGRPNHRGAQTRARPSSWASVTGVSGSADEIRVGH